MGTKRNMIDTEMQEGGTLKKETQNERRKECIKRFEEEEHRSKNSVSNVLKKRNTALRIKNDVFLFG